VNDASDDPPEGRLPTPAEIVRPLADALTARRTSLRRSVFVALDGRSGAGKSTLAAVLADACRSRDVTVAVIGGDDFYAGGSAESWERRSPAEKADQVIDWRRQHRVLDDLRLRGNASWYPFDWEAPDWDSDRVPLRSTPMSMTRADIVILEGAYSARPELHDVLDIRVLLNTPPEQRRRQLLEREGDHYRTDWEARWSAAEDHYFGVIMPPNRFDHIAASRTLPHA
jgi:uridine kinase